MNDFYSELCSLINRYSAENDSNTPDYLLVKFIEGCLNSFNNVTKERDKWYGVHLEPANKYFLKKEK